MGPGRYSSRRCGRPVSLRSSTGCMTAAVRSMDGDMNVRRRAVARRHARAGWSLPESTLPSQRSTHSAMSRSVAPNAATAKKMRAARIWRIYAIFYWMCGCRLARCRIPNRSAFAETADFDRFGGEAFYGRKTPISGPRCIRFWRRPTAAPATTPKGWRPPRGCISRRRMRRPPRVEAFGNSLVILVDREHPGFFAVVEKADGAHPAYGRRAD